MERNPNYTKQFQGLPEDWDTIPAVFERVLQEHIFHCEGTNCSIKGKALVKGGMLKFVKLVTIKMVTKEDGVTPERDKRTGEKIFDHQDWKRKVLCERHTRFQEEVARESTAKLPDKFRTRGDKVEVNIFTLFQNLNFLRGEIWKNKRPERVAKFFLSLTEGAGIEAGVALNCIVPFDPAIPKDEAHNYLIRGGEVIGMVMYEDRHTYNGVRCQNRAAFVRANLYLYSCSTLEYVEERLVEWRMSSDEKSATRAKRQAEAVEQGAVAKARQAEAVRRRDEDVAEALAFWVDKTAPSTEEPTGGGRKEPRGNGRKGGRADGAPKRKSSPPPAARQIAAQLDDGERAALSSDTPDVIVDDQAGSSKPTYAVALGDRPEISEKLEEIRRLSLCK